MFLMTHQNFRRSFQRGGNNYLNINNLRVEISFPLGSGTDYDLVIDLFAEVNVENCRARVGMN
jgi:hypothetical protein